MAFTVDYATLHKAAGDVRSTRTEVDGDLRRLQGLAEELGGQWRGQAATGFNSLMARFGEDAVKLQQALGDIADLLDKEANAHQHNDEEQGQMINKFTSVLNP
jgi:early secretory antigenic target protein ESAT-6